MIKMASEQEVRKLEREQLFALFSEIKLGLTIQRDHPEIAGWWRNGVFVPEIVNHLGLCEQYGVTQKVAEESVRFSLSGHDGRAEPKYGGLISDEEERAKIAQIHVVNNGVINGKYIRDKKLGVHGRSFAEMSAHGKEGGRISGAYIRDKKLGVHGRSPAEMSAHGRKGGKKGGDSAVKKKKGWHGMSLEDQINAGRNSAIERGFVPWYRKGDRIEDRYCLIDEKVYTYYLAGQLVQNSGKDKGKPDYVHIQDRINLKYHNSNEVRTLGAIKQVVYQEKKKLKEKKEKN